MLHRDECRVFSWPLIMLRHDLKGAKVGFFKTLKSYLSVTGSDIS